MTVFWYLLLGHLLADFVFKKRVVAKKDTLYFAWRGLIYFVVLVICCWEYLPLTWFSIGAMPIKGIGAIACGACLYFLVNIAGRYAKTSTGKYGIAFFLSRQFVLVSILLIIMPILSFTGDYRKYIYGPDLLFIINAGIIVSYVISSFLICLAFSIDEDYDTDDLFDKRFLNMLLRLVLLLLIIMPGWFYFGVAVLLIIIAIKVGYHRGDRFYFYIGTCMAFAFALFCRSVFQGIC